MREIYASLEITQSEIRFIVAKYFNKNLKVIHKDKEKGNWLGKRDEILEEKAIIFRVKKMIENYEKMFNSKLASISLVYPSRTLEIINASPFVVFSNADKRFKIIDEFDIKKLNDESMKANFNSNKSIVNIKPIVYYVDNNIQKGFVHPPIGMKAGKLEARYRIYTIDKNVKDDFSKILKGIGKEELSGTIDLIALAKSTINPEEYKNTNILIDWRDDTTNIAFYTKETLIEKKELPFGIKNLIQKISKNLHSKEGVAKNYLFNLINFSQNDKSNDIVYRKWDSIQKINIEFTNKQIKNFIYNEFYVILNTISEYIYSELGNQLNSGVKVYHVGKIAEISGVNHIFASSSLKELKSKIYYSKLLGASENWTAALCGVVQINKQQNLRGDIIKTSERTFNTNDNNLDKKNVQRIQPMPQQGQPMMQQPMPQQGQPMMQQPRTQGQPMMQQPRTQGQPMMQQPMPQVMPYYNQPMMQQPMPQQGQPMMQMNVSGLNAPINHSQMHFNNIENNDIYNNRNFTNNFVKR